jgi:hypothetical protein
LNTSWKAKAWRELTQRALIIVIVYLSPSILIGRPTTAVPRASV